MSNKIQLVTIKDIREAIEDAVIDTEYREAMDQSLIVLGYLSGSSISLYYSTPKQKKELKEVSEKPLDSNQISEIIHLIMYQMRNDFTYGRFKPVALKFLDISQQMRNTNEKNKTNNKKNEKPKCNIYSAFGNMIEIMGLASKILKKNNMVDESREMIERATMSYSYDEALDIINEYVETIKKSKEQEDEEEFD